MSAPKFRDHFELTPGRFVGRNERAFFICEGGINHNGDMELARRIVEEAKIAGADAVKFQKRSKYAILTQQALDAPYVSHNSFGMTYGEHRDHLEFSEKQWQELKKYSDSIGIPLTGSGWDEESVDCLDRIGVPFFKVASADLMNFPLLAHTASKGKPMVVSTGMACMDQVEAAVAFLFKFTDKVAILHCTSTYPAKPEVCNIQVIRTYQDAFPGAVVGYSGHENGVSISEAAVVLGAKIVERHFTLDRTLKGGDHAASLEPRGFKELVDRVRKIEAAMGDGVKRVMEGEESIKKKLGKSAVSRIFIPANTVITADLLCFKSPGDGVAACDAQEKLVGKTAVSDIAPDTTIYESLVKN